MKNHEFMLIKSTYSAADAKEVLLSLVYDKIKFLNLQILSLQERFGRDTTHLEQRVRELTAEEKELQEFLNAFENGDYTIDIDCKVKLTAKPNAAAPQTASQLELAQ